MKDDKKQKIYVVLDGDCHLVGTFSTRKKAERYASDANDIPAGSHPSWRVTVYESEVDELKDTRRRDRWIVDIRKDGGAEHARVLHDTPLVSGSGRGEVWDLGSCVSATSFRSAEHALRLARQYRLKLLKKG